MKVAVLGTGRSAEILRAFLRTSYRDGVLAEVEQADVGVVDLDAYGAQQWVEDWRERYPKRPVIALSLREPESEGVIWLKKPLRAEELVQALKRAVAPQTKVVVREQTPGSVAQAAAGIAAQSRPQGTRLRQNWAEDSTGHYNPADYLQGWLVKAYHQATVTGIAVRVETGWEPIVVYPKLKSVWTGGMTNSSMPSAVYPSKRSPVLTGDRGAWTSSQFLKQRLRRLLNRSNPWRRSCGK